MSRVDIKKLKQYARQHSIRSMGIFGSRARGDAKATSDLDILIECKPSRSLLELSRMQRELSQLLQIKVDLITKGALSPYIKKNILKELKPIV